MVLLWLLAALLAFAPAGILLWYIRRIDKFEPEPWHTVGLAFLAGCLSVVPALIIEPLLGQVKFGGFLGTVWSAFIIAALTEEFSKGAFAYTFMWKRPEFNEVMDGVVYFGVAHMGFAVTENLLYIFLKSGGNIAQALLTAFARTTTAVPLHVTVGMIMGYHMGMVRFAQRELDRRSHLVQAIGLPILLHGVYDLAAFNGEIKVEGMADLLRAGFGSALLYAACVALWIFLLPRIRKAQEASPWRPLERPSLPVAPTVCGNCGTAYPMGANYCHHCACPVAQQSNYYLQGGP